MVIFEPSYYKKFSCIADKCRTNCCQGWDVIFDKADYDRLRSKRFPAKLRETLRGCLRRSNNDRNYGTFVFPENNVCPMLENRMCSLQISVGAENLPKVCRSYPRNKYIYRNVICNSCVNSCERVLYLMLDEALSFKRREATVFEAKNSHINLSEKIPDELEDHFEMIQTLCIAIMQNRDYSLENRLLLLGMTIKELHPLWKERRLDEIPGWFTKWAQAATGNCLEGELSKLEGQYLIGVQSCAKTLSYLFVQNVNEKAYIDRAFAGTGVKVSYSVENVEAGTEKLKQDFTIDTKVLLASMGRFNEVLEPYRLFMENIIVNLLLTETFPLRFPDSFFDSYLSLCHNYALIKFVAMGYVGESGTIDDVIDGIVHISRTINHNNKRMISILDELKETGTDTLAHMAYLIRI